MHLCQLCSTRYTAVQIKKSTSVTKVATIKIQMLLYVPVKSVAPINYRLKNEVSIMLLCLLIFILKSLHTITKKYLVEKYLFEGSHYEKCGEYAKEAINETTKSTLFTVCKNEWNTKKDTG